MSIHFLHFSKIVAKRDEKRRWVTQTRRRLPHYSVYEMNCAPMLYSVHVPICGQTAEQSENP